MPGKLVSKSTAKAGSTLPDFTLPVEEIQPASTINTRVKIQSQIDAHLFYSGAVTRKQYEWVRAGAIIEVDQQDVPELLSKRLGGKTCCGGGSDGNVIFRVVGD